MTGPRIVSLLSSATEMLYGLGLGPQVVAVSHECDYPDDVQGKPRATRTRIAAEAASGDIDRQVRDMLAAGEPLYEIDGELVRRLRPELIVTQAQCDVCAVRYQDVLSLVGGSPELAATQVVSLSPNSLADVLADVRRVAAATGRAAAGDRYLSQLQARIDAVRALGEGIPPIARPRAVCLEWLDPLMAAGNWMPELVKLAGGQPGLSDAARHSPTVSWEQVRDYDPQVIIVMPCGFNLERALSEATPLPRLPGWGDVAAVRAGAVFAVDGNAYFNRSGPRLVESLELLADLFHAASHATEVPPRWRSAARRI